PSPLYSYPYPRHLHSFPTRRSSDLLTTAKVLAHEARGTLERKELKIGFVPIACATPLLLAEPMGFYALQGLRAVLVKLPGWGLVDRKSTRLNSSHVAISYAVFCLKK